MAFDANESRWKLFLPPKWREASALNEDGIMDPNLTLAHLTHNTAVILLHQSIAFPSTQLRLCPVRLPSSSSVETCLAAASEISTIAHQFLTCSLIPADPQFNFCLFVAGRMLLAHSEHYKQPLSHDFESLVESLQELSRRWSGPYEEPGAQNLASRFANRLIEARAHSSSVSRRHSLDLGQPAYFNHGDNPELSFGKRGNVAQQRMDTKHPENNHTPSTTVTTNNITDSQHENQSPESISLANPPLPASFQPMNSPFSRDFAYDYPNVPPPAVPEFGAPAPMLASSEVPFFQPMQYPSHLNDPSFSTALGDATQTSFEGLEGIFDDTFLKMQRVSMYGRPNGTMEGAFGA